MPHQEQQFANEEIYHLILRAIDNNLLFKDINDYYRGVFSIYEFNNVNSVNIRDRREARASFKKLVQSTQAPRTPTSGQVLIEPDKRDKLVEVMSFCLMPNHIHLLARQIKDGGISRFMQKVGGGYAGYFNRKYQRKGHVFMDRFESVQIESDNQLKVIFVYIHANPLSLIEPGWKELGIKNPAKAIAFLENEYKWFSYPDFIGRKNFPSVTSKDFLSEVMGGSEDCKDAIKNWIMHKSEMVKHKNILLDY
jgi:putative transposase